MFRRKAAITLWQISIHALLAESDIFQCFVDHFQSYFYPRSPCGERQALAYEVMAWNDISIHALLAESDFLPYLAQNIRIRFLSTLSLRRATSLIDGRRDNDINFYPRSPCGERLTPARISSRLLLISIHALLAESDSGTARHT